MRLNRLVMAFSCTAFAACGVDLTTSVAETATALETAQTDFCAFRARADACRQDFEGCVAAAGADREACRATLHDCLPPPPPRPEGMGGHCEGMDDGGVRPPRPPGGPGEPSGPGGPGEPPRPPGGPGEPPRPPGGPGEPHGPGGPGEPHGPGGPDEPRGPRPEFAVIQHCRDVLTTCLAASPGDATCIEAERACERDAFRAAFEAVCTDAAARCAAEPNDECIRLTRRCAEGIDGRVDADGRVCGGGPVAP